MAPGSREWTVLGLMSGTSMDGVDACLAHIELSEDHFAFDLLDGTTVPFRSEVRRAISHALSEKADDVAALHFRLGEVYARVAEKFLRGRKVDLVGCHGQTLAHVDGSHTLQVGSTAYLARQLNVPVASNFREADVAAGGNGAPLMPFLDWLLAKSRPKPAVMVNIGGVANIAAVAPGAAREAVIGFDTGPGMGLIDEGAGLLFGAPYDEDARHSNGGTVSEELLTELMSHPFIQRPPPKSTGRDEFGVQLVKEIKSRFPLPPSDLLRSLVRFTGRSIAVNIRQSVEFHDEVDTLIVSGGGVHHPLVMSDLQAELPGMEVVTSRELGVDPDLKEALLIAVLAVAQVEGVSGNMPGVTGAREQVVLGQLAPAQGAS